MSDGNSVKDWIKSAELAKKFGRVPFFGVGVQTGVDDGSFLVVIFDKASKRGIKGGMPATRSDIDKLKEFGITVMDKGGWLDG